MKTNNMVWMIGGEAGSGIDKAGNIFARTLSRGGLELFGNFEYPSLIRGGHNTFAVRIGEKQVVSSTDVVDLLVALNHETISIHEKDVQEGSVIIYDSDDFRLEDSEKKDSVMYLHVPFRKIAKEIGGKDLFRNTVALGATLALVDYDITVLEEVIDYQFHNKGKEIVDLNIQVAKTGFDYIKEQYPNYQFQCRLQKVEAEKRMVINGNTCIALGAIQGGCKFVASYPMTPGTSVFQYIAAQARKYNIIVKHTEDEISAINMIIGAGYAGCRSLASTSGGGFALMVEALGMAGMAEIPMVVVDAQRPGPSTGLPTHTAQGDLQFMLHASQGDFPFIVMAPGDHEQCFYLGFEAMNLAEKYQCPVGILTDKYLGDSVQTLKPFDLKNLKIDRGALLTEDEAGNIENYKRYELNDSGISKRVLPGYDGCEHRQTSYEHDESGNFCEDPEMAIAMTDKRMKKMEKAKKEIPAPKLVGSEDADVTLICWGSSLCAVKEAYEELNEKGIKTSYLQIVYASPFHSEVISKILRNSKKNIIVEGNDQSQMAQLIKMHTGISMDHFILKYNGRPIIHKEVTETVEKIMKDHSLIRNVLHYASS